jgi:hypothetical protein
MVMGSNRSLSLGIPLFILISPTLSFPYNFVSADLFSLTLSMQISSKCQFLHVHPAIRTLCCIHQYLFIRQQLSKLMLLQLKWHNASDSVPVEEAFVTTSS